MPIKPLHFAIGVLLWAILVLAVNGIGRYISHQERASYEALAQ